MAIDGIGEFLIYSVSYDYYEDEKIPVTKNEIVMNRKEAKQIIQAELKPYRTKSYSELVQMIDAEPVTGELVGSSGKRYQIEIQAFWDDKPNGNIRVLGAIDDGGWRAFVPLTDDFIKSPSNEFIGE